MAAQAKPALPRIVELLRVSGQAQSDRDTPADQRAALDKLREQFPGVLVERIDSGAVRAVSGAADLNDRPDLRRLAELARTRAFDELRVRHLDRLTRHTDPRERFAIFGMVQDAGAVIRDASGHTIDPASEIGEVDFFLQTWMASKERKRIAERTMAARKRLSAQGVPMTTIPYGRVFNREQGTWGINETEASIYRDLFADVIAGKSLRKVAESLNERGITSPRGAAWGAGGVRQMIVAPSAVGKVTSYGHVLACPAIVDPATQKRAMEVLRKARSHSGPNTVKHEALLRKLARCGVCGALMHVTVGGQNKHLYYTCASHRKPGHDKDCGIFHPIESVDAAIRERLRPVLSNPEELIRALRRPVKDSGAADLGELRADLADLATREEKLTRLASKGLMSDAVYEKQAREIARLREAAQSRISVAQAQVEAAARASANVKDIEAALKGAQKDIARDDFAGWRRVVELLFGQDGCTVTIAADGEVKMDGLIPVVHPSSGTTSTSS